MIITTSFSGRGFDIQLGGKKGSIPDDQLKKYKNNIKELGGLFVIGTERMESEELIIKQEVGLDVKEMKEVQFFMSV